MEDFVNLKDLKAAIPPHCFKISATRSLAYLARDIIYASILVALALQIERVPYPAVRILAWITYTYLQGCVGTGLWILGHECGHGAFSPYGKLNDCLGWLIHSFLLVPFFSWKITHARHHRYTGHPTKDVVFVPEKEEELRAFHPTRLKALIDYAEDTPVVTLARLLQHQLLGWQIYLFLYLTSGKNSLPASEQSKKSFDYSHFNPRSRLFTDSQRSLVVISDIGLVLTLALLAVVASQVGVKQTILLYFVPYFWVHHWIVAITYLHHTHPDVPYHTEESWTFTKGALGTIDRSVGFIGRHFFHEIVDYHVVHHLFPKIPFYHAEEATRAIQPLLKEQYVQTKDESFMKSLWDTFQSCNYVSGPKSDGPAEDGKMYWVTKRSETKTPQL